MIVQVETDKEATTPIRLDWDGCHEPLYLTKFEAEKLYFGLWAAFMEIEHPGVESVAIISHKSIETI